MTAMTTDTAGNGILERLKTETLPEHRRVEQTFRILDPALTRADYRVWMERVYGLHAGFEQALDACAVTLDIDWNERRKSRWLREDLLHLGRTQAEIDRLPVCQPPQGLDLPDRAFGALYVLEGSTLGGRMIGQQLEKRHGLTAGAGASFFNAYGELLMPRWRSFRERLQCAATDPDTEQRMIDAARETFATFDRWLAGAAETLT